MFVILLSLRVERAEDQTQGKGYLVVVSVSMGFCFSASFGNEEGHPGLSAGVRLDPLDLRWGVGCLN